MDILRYLRIPFEVRHLENLLRWIYLSKMVKLQKPLFFYMSFGGAGKMLNYLLLLLPDIFFVFLVELV